MNSSHHRTRGMISLLLSFAVILTLVGLALPGSARAQEDQEADATLRIVHASPGAPAIDVLIDGQPFASNIAFGAATDYAAIPAGDYKVQVVATGQAADTAVIDTDLKVESGKAYIFAAAKPLNEIEGKLFEVNLDAVADGKARVRAIHLAPDAGDVDIVVTGGDELFGGVGFEKASDYKDVDPGVISLDVRGDGDRILTSAAGIEILPGQTYDIIALGQVSDQSLTLLPLATNVSRPCATVLGLEAGEQDSCVRVVHASAGSPAVDVYVNGSPGVTGLAFGTATEFVAIPAGDKVKIQVTSEGASLDNAVIDTEQELKPGQAYDMVAIGPLDKIELAVSELNLTPLPEGQARLRVIQAAEDVDTVDLAVAESDPLIENLKYKSTSDYSVVDAGEYTFQIRTGDDNIAIQQDTLIEPGISYDFYLVGRADDSTLALVVLSAQASEREGGVSTPTSSGEANEVATVVSEGTPPTDADADSDSVDTQTETDAGAPSATATPSATTAPVPSATAASSATVAPSATPTPSPTPSPTATS